MTLNCSCKNVLTTKLQFQGQKEDNFQNFFILQDFSGPDWEQERPWDVVYNIIIQWILHNITQNNMVYSKKGKEIWITLYCMLLFIVLNASDYLQREAPIAHTPCYSKPQSSLLRSARIRAGQQSEWQQEKAYVIFVWRVFCYTPLPFLSPSWP